MRTILLFIVAFAIVPATTFCQQTGDTPQAIAKMPGDTAKVNRLVSLARQVQFADPQQALANLDRAIDLAENLNYPLGVALGYSLKASIFVNRTSLDTGTMYLKLAKNALQKEKENADYNYALGMITNTEGVIFQQKQFYDSATNSYVEALRLFEKSGNKSKLFYTYYNLSTLYDFMGNVQKAAAYATDAYLLAQQVRDTTFIIRSLILKANSALAQKRYDSASLFSQQGLKLSNEQRDGYAIGKFNEAIGVDFIENSNNYDSAIAYLERAQVSFSKLNSPYDLALVWQNLGNAYFRNNNLQQARDYARKATEAAKQMDLQQILFYSLPDLVKIEEKSGNIRQAYDYLQEWVTVKDTLTARNNRTRVDELEIRFQTAQKDAQLQLQRVSIRQKKTWNYILAIGAVSLLIIGLLFLRNYRNKQKLQQQRISELETEKQLAAAEAVLKGEEQERTRLAKDLHDGLGGMLSGIKYSFQNMKETLVLTPDNARAFERSLDMLDSSIREMRRVAHNMMPETLVRYGLDEALEEFCNEIDRSGAVHASYQSIDMDKVELEQTAAVNVYRIVQELVTNAIRHAAASQILVQVHASEQDGLLSVTVEDDGKGFDPETIRQSDGIGWNNILNRIDFLKGKVDIQSSPGKGTSVLIETSTR